MTARTTISLDRETYARALNRQRDLGYKSFSEYISFLIREDALSGGSHIRRAASSLNETAAAAPVSQAQTAARIIKYGRRR